MVNGMRPQTVAQAAQQNNRDGAGRYATKVAGESGVELALDAPTSLDPSAVGAERFEVDEPGTTGGDTSLGQEYTFTDVQATGDPAAPYRITYDTFVVAGYEGECGDNLTIDQVDECDDVTYRVEQITTVRTCTDLADPTGSTVDVTTDTGYARAVTCYDLVDAEGEAEAAAQELVTSLTTT